MPLSSPVYGALRLTAPGVALPATPQAIAELDQLQQTLTPFVEEVVNTTRSSLSAAENSPAGHPLTRASALIPMGAGLVNEIIDTVDHWNDPGFNRGANVFAIALWVTAAVYGVFVMWLHHRQISIRKAEEQKNAQAKATWALQRYLQNSNLMVQACLSQDPSIQNALPALFAKFNTYTLKQAKAGAAPNDLVIAWAGAAVMINLPANDAGRAGLGQFIQNEIVPLMTQYSTQLQKGLTNLGFPLPANDAAAPPLPLNAQPASPSSQAAAHEGEEHIEISE